MAATLHISQVNPEQLEPAYTLLRRFFIEEGFDVPPEEIRLNLKDFLSRTDYGAFLAYLGAELAGIATVSTSTSVELGPMAELDDLYVVPEARGQGVARALVTTALDWCRAQGRTYIQLTITPEGEAAHNLTAFYDRLGFVNTDRKLFSRTLP